MDMSSGAVADPSYMTYFQSKTVFITGATGNLGSCTVYKLVMELNVQKIYLLVRGSKDKAIRKWRRTLGTYADHLLSSDKVHFIVGDVSLPRLGMSAAELHLLEEETNIVVHTAANISLMDGIEHCMKNNCDPVLELAKLAANFKRLDRFVYVSSVYVNSFLSDGLIREKIYPLTDEDGTDIDAELERQDIYRTSSSPHTERFAWPYALSKYLGERLLLERSSSLPILIVRASTIGPSFRSPFPLFGEETALPLSQGLKIIFRDFEASRVWHMPANGTAGGNILDEIPVDWVSNVMLLHITAQSHGVIHASAGNYLQQTAHSMLTSAVSRSKDDLSELHSLEWIPESSGPQCALANFLVIGNRDWNFSCQKSAKFKHLDGLLSIDVTEEEVLSFQDGRWLSMLNEVQRESSAE